MRMDKYKETKKENLENEEKTLSREVKNKDLYKDVYLNNTFVDVNNFLATKDNEEEPQKKEEVIEAEEVYEEKSYDVNDYLKKAHENHVLDNANHNLENTNFRALEGEIKKLIANIEEKEASEDIFSDLKGDNEDTMIEGVHKTDEFNTDIYKVLVEDEEYYKSTVILDKALGDETVSDLSVQEDDKLEHTFEKIYETDKIMSKKMKKLPIIVFCSMLLLLIIVIIIIIIK